MLTKTAQISLESVTQTQPHPNAGCILTDQAGQVVGQASLWAQGTTAPEVLATQQADGLAKNGTAYLNLETGDCYGDDAGIRALVASGVSRCVIGLRHPLECSRGRAISALQSHGILVDVLGDWESTLSDDLIGKSDEVYASNEALLHRAALGKPMGVVKYAMTLDGKIATTSGHSAWISSTLSREIVFKTRAASDAVIIGGQTVRRDNPRLTTRQEGGHQPIRIVMSRTLDLPLEANMWDITVAPTIVATQKGAKKEIQRILTSKGVEVIEFDFLTPEAVAEYCFQRGFLTCLWECGGTLAAPAVADDTIHKVMAFVAPKIIGGNRAPTPMGDLGFVEMTQAIDIQGPQWQQVGPDIMVSGYLPVSGGPKNLARSIGLFHDKYRGSNHSGIQHPHQPVISSLGQGKQQWLARSRKLPQTSPHFQAEFYKAWDYLGCLSNFSPHPILMPDCAMDEAFLASVKQELTSSSDAAVENGRLWPSTEHYYQSQKFYGRENDRSKAIIEEIARARSPEEAAKLGRTAERDTPELVRSDWSAAKRAVMLAALLRKFSTHECARNELLKASTLNLSLVESSPNDFYWGRGIDGSGDNMLGQLLMHVREELYVPPPAAAHDASSTGKSSASSSL
jgi:diaminohydroxyphosphoribosylaminopyrimidine deaminase/5-amino-6-(5-phosphoribosylamino)uracil reductase